IDQTMEGANEGGLLGWLRENFGALLGRIRTTDPGVNTSAGPRPNVSLEGDADPGRMREQHSEAHAYLVAERDRTAGALRDHPGQRNIQPIEREAPKRVPVATEVTARIDKAADQSVADSANAPIPPYVRATPHN